MTVNRRSKFSRMRGSHTHGWGSKKKHRGSGNRGGKGWSGAGKKGDAIKTLIWKDSRYFGKHGFKKKGAVVVIKPVNLVWIEKNLDSLVSKGIAKLEQGIYSIDVKQLGFNKVLGCGKLAHKCRITAQSFSREAEEKISALGGQAIKSE